MKHFSIRIKGAIQGVGFRPFVYRLAQTTNLKGYVKNTPAGVEIEVEGDEKQIEKFIRMLETRRPPLAIIDSILCEEKQPIGFIGFKILESTGRSDILTLVLPDIATCGECLHEVLNEHERRFNYPFTNCTNCGPRFTIIERLPYDRKNTTMKRFKMCKACETEYQNPADRRFHAQPIACPDCGPEIWLTDNLGNTISRGEDALRLTAAHIRKGRIVAVKGLGGFLLLCDARNEDAVSRLRRKKYREEKPFAVMYPSLSMVKKDCYLSKDEEKLLLSPQCPIVLLRRKKYASVAGNVAPSNPYLGVMLPYTPLHHILLKMLSFPVVATSGNMTDDPIAIDNDEALSRLSKIADYFLMHNRPIKRRVDDSVVRVFHGRLMMIRRARGYAPMPLPVRNPENLCVLGLGAHLKNTISIIKGENLFISQHIGDLETREAIQSFREVIDSLSQLYKVRPEVIAVDLHPRYISTLIGEELKKKWRKNLVRVQHHHAHIASCMCENALDGYVLGVAWDGVGYGLDGEAWGSEFLIADYTGFKRIAHFLSFPLPGGETAIRTPSHSGVGMLYTLLGDSLLDPEMRFLPVIQALPEKDIVILLQSMKSGFNAPLMYGVGRLFDGLASILGVRQRCSFEAQGAMELEFLATEAYRKSSRVKPYRYEIKGEQMMVVDWRPMLECILDDIRNGINVSEISLKFHQTLADIISDLAERSELKDVVLSGGVFQNVLLLELIMKSAPARFKFYTHSHLPPNDGCISAGQCAVALAQMR